MHLGARPRDLRLAGGGDVTGNGRVAGLTDERIYEVFARKDRADRFEHVGTVTAPNRELARVYAWQTYDEAKWFEMIVAPRAAFHRVNRDEVPFTLWPEVVS